MFRGVILVFSGVMLGFRRVIFGSEGLYRVQWGYVVSIQHVDLPPCRAGSAVKKIVASPIFLVNLNSERIKMKGGLKVST